MQPALPRPIAAGLARLHGSIPADGDLLHERPPLSKGFLAGEEPEERVFINPPAFSREHGIEVQLATPICSLDTEQRRLHGEDGTAYEYEHVLLATGTCVRTLDVPGGGCRACTTCACLTIPATSARRWPRRGGRW
ncbi:MAG: hypothetical protein C4290_06460 [Chloroflexota bacterium]